MGELDRLRQAGAALAWPGLEVTPPLPAPGPRTAGVWSAAYGGRCEYANAQPLFFRTAAGEAYDCVCSLSRAPLQWAPSLSCMDGNGAAIRGAASPACRIYDMAGKQYRM